MWIGLAVVGMAHAGPFYVDDQGGFRLDVDAFERVELLEAPRDHRGPGAEGIVNGEVETGYQGVVALAAMSNWGGYVFCSGTLIDPSYVLTAAHCVSEMDYMDSQPGTSVEVLVGYDLLNIGFTDSRVVDEWAEHPDYNPSWLSNDIGIVHLAQPLQGIDLAVLNDEALTGDWLGQDMTFLGFGVTSDNGDDAGIKRITDIEVQDYDSQFIYSFTSGTNLCSGDSGGPGFENTANGTQELAGVNSFVSPGCVGGSNGVTRVDQHIDWIQSYAPDVLLGGSGSGSNPGGSDAEAPEIPDAPNSAIDREMGEALSPTKGDYRVGLRCATGGGSGVPGWLLSAGILGVLWRRRA